MEGSEPARLHPQHELLLRELDKLSLDQDGHDDPDFNAFITLLRNTTGDAERKFNRDAQDAMTRSSLNVAPASTGVAPAHNIIIAAAAPAQPQVVNMPLSAGSAVGRSAVSGAVTPRSLGIRVPAKRAATPADRLSKRVAPATGGDPASAATMVAASDDVDSDDDRM